MSKINLIAIADNPFDQELGLQYVRQLPENSGMLFDFKRPKVLNFWMQNTYLDLDIAFIDANGKIVKTQRMIPLSLRTVSSGTPCVMAVEVAAGTLDKLGASVGKRVSVDVENKTVTIE